MKNMTDMEYIKRDIYLQKLIDSRLNGDVKVVTGPRRCGKSWLLTRLYKDYLIKDGVPEEDIIIVKSPVGMPGRAIRNRFMEEVEAGKTKVERCFRCLEHCDPVKIPYCITRALINAAEGDEEHALVFCGSNAWRSTKMETVHEVMLSLAGEA